jgi:hypothetical protein
VILRDAKLLEVKGTRVVAGKVRVVVQGGAAFVYVTDAAKRDEVVGKVKQAFAGVEGVQKVATVEDYPGLGVADPKVDPKAPDLILFASMGYAFGDTAAGALSFREKPERKGTHGHDADLPELKATFVAWGRGTKPGARLGDISNTDVAPTVARLLGISMAGVEGRVLAEALADAPPPTTKSAGIRCSSETSAWPDKPGTAKKRARSTPDPYLLPFEAIAVLVVYRHAPRCLESRAGTRSVCADPYFRFGRAQLRRAQSEPLPDHARGAVHRAD